MSYPMNIPMTGFRWFSNIFQKYLRPYALWAKIASALEGLIKYRTVTGTFQKVLYCTVTLLYDTDH